MRYQKLLNYSILINTVLIASSISTASEIKKFEKRCVDELDRIVEIINYEPDENVKTTLRYLSGVTGTNE
jgi:hypothetical protein